MLLGQETDQDESVDFCVCTPGIPDVELKAWTSSKTPDMTLYQIIYKSTNRYDFAKELKIYDTFFKQAMISDVSDGPRPFLEPLAKLMYLYARQLPLKRGSAGVAQWLMEAMAQKKGIELGDFSFDDKISWDFKALLTLPNSRDLEKDVEAFIPKEYVDWFCERLFPNAKLVDVQEKAARNVSGSLVTKVMSSVFTKGANPDEGGAKADPSASKEGEDSGQSVLRRRHNAGKKNGR